MPSHKMRMMNGLFGREYPRKLKCELCGIIMVDTEPGLTNGDFHHPANGCRNGGRRGQTYSYTCSGRQRDFSTQTPSARARSGHRSRPTDEVRPREEAWCPCGGEAPPEIAMSARYSTPGDLDPEQVRRAEAQVYYAHRYPRGSFHHASPSRWWVELHGLHEPIVPVRVRLFREGADAEPLPGAADYYGWLKSGDDKFTFIWPSRIQLNICFAYGPEAEEQRGRGRVVHLVVEPTDEV